MPKISVIVPVYGVEKYIERCAESLFQQTLGDIEYIFIDDCTPDASIDILNDVIEKYQFRIAEKKNVVRIVKMKSNSGQAAVRRKGLQLATGDYIIHCDSDDWINTDMYRIMYDRAIQDDSDVVVCDFNYTDGFSFNRRIKACYAENKDFFLRDMLYQKVSWALWNKLVKKDCYIALASYPSSAMGEDMVITTQLILRSHKISYVCDTLYNYYFNSKSIMNIQTKEQCLGKYIQLKFNTDILLPILEKNLDRCSYKKIEHVLAYNLTIPLLPHICDREFYLIWRKEMLSHYALLFDNNVKGVFKLMYLSIFTKTYILYKCFNKMKACH